VVPLEVTNSLVDVRGGLGEHDAPRALDWVVSAVSTAEAYRAKKGLAATLLLGNVLRSRGEHLELLPKEADRRSQPLGIGGEGKGDGTGWWQS